MISNLISIRSISELENYEFRFSRIPIGLKIPPPAIWSQPTGFWSGLSWCCQIGDEITPYKICIQITYSIQNSTQKCMQNLFQNCTEGGIQRALVGTIMATRIPNCAIHRHAPRDLPSFVEPPVQSSKPKSFSPILESLVKVTKKRICKKMKLFHLIGHESAPRPLISLKAPSLHNVKLTI
jgi:hypothetical protein